MLRFWSSLALSWAALTPGVGRADGAVPLRRLCLDAPLVVLATPLDPLAPTRFRVRRVFRCTVPPRPAVGAIFAPAGLDAERVRTFDPPLPTTKEPRPRAVTQALLFLKPEPGGTSWRLLPTGFRFCTADGRLLAPADNAHRPAVHTARWAVVFRRVQEDSATLAKLDDLRHGGRPGRRVEDLLAWIERHRGEFAAVSPGTDESPTGWDHLQLDVFDWIFALADAEDAWRAVRLFAELNGNEAPRLQTPTFTNPHGRAVLLRVLADPGRLSGDRVRAAQLLGQPITLWPTAPQQRQGGQPVGPGEQDALLEQLPPLLAVKDDGLRVALARAVRLLSWPESPADRRSLKALPALLRAFKDVQPGAARDELARTICRLASPTQWKELTGNPPGVCAVLGDLERRASMITFWLSLESDGGAVHEAPTLIVERLGNFGFIAETKRLPLPVLNLDGGWAAGWTGATTLAAQVNLGAYLKPGNAYRVKVEGFVGKGKDRQRWISEPRKFTIPAAPRGGREGGPGDLMYKLDK